MPRNKVILTEKTEDKQQLGELELVSESVAWATVSSIVEASYKFWKDFLVLRRGPNATDQLTQADDKEFIYAIRAVSWVESQHGSGAGVTASRDPMQCGNPKDAWYLQLAGTATQFDRFVRGGKGSKNYNSDELPSAVEVQKGWNTAASISNLDDVNLGHGSSTSDNGFDQVISYYWAVPHLIWDINAKSGGRPAYNCGNVTRNELKSGCVEYNGCGDPKYLEKINDAYGLFATESVGPCTDLRAAALNHADQPS